jgi:hypothetical protein
VGARASDQLTIWAIYKHPLDYPGKWVLRGHDIGSGTVDPRPDCVVADSYEEIVAQLPRGLVKIQRDPNDDQVIYETWL